MPNFSLTRVLGKKKLSTHKKHKHWVKTKKAKRLFSFFRWLHIYISCALFSLILFFSLTGVTLNHPEWIDKSPETIFSFELPENLALDNNGEYQTKQIQAYIEKLTGLSNSRSVDIALDIGELTYDYPLPAGYAFVTVIIEENTIEIEQVKGNVLALFNDLHKGRHSGKAWAWLIDVSAVLMVLFTLAGVIILFQNAKHRKTASLILLLGTLTPIVIYFLVVPRLIS